MFENYNMFGDYIDDILKDRGFKLIIDGYEGLRYYKICENTHEIPYAEVVEIWIGNKDVIVKGFANSPTMFRKHFVSYETDKPSLSIIEEATLKAIENAKNYR